MSNRTLTIHRAEPHGETEEAILIPPDAVLTVTAVTPDGEGHPTAQTHERTISLGVVTGLKLGPGPK